MLVNVQAKQQRRKVAPKNKRKRAPVRRGRMDRGDQYLTMSQAKKGVEQILPKYTLSTCATEYLAALTNPFSTRLSAPCIPDLHDAPSWKNRSMQRGTFVIGEGGFGYIVVSPKVSANNVAAAAVTTSAFTSTGIVSTNSGTLGVVHELNGQAPFSNADVTDGNFSSRLVGCAIEVSYIGTLLNRGGRFIIGRLPTTNTPTNTLNGASVNDLLNKQTFITPPVTGRRVGICYLPMNSNDYTYLVGAYNLTDVGENGTLFIGVDGAEPGNSFSYRIIRWHEYISNGDSSIPNVTRTASDVAGVSAIKNALQDKVETPGPDLFTRVYKAIAATSPEDVSGYVSTAKQVGTALSAMKMLL